MIKDKKKRIPVMVYLSKEEKEKLEGLKKDLSANGMTVSSSNVLRMCLLRYEDRLID